MGISWWDIIQVVGPVAATAIGGAMGSGGQQTNTTGTGGGGK